MALRSLEKKKLFHEKKSRVKNRMRNSYHCLFLFHFNSICGINIHLQHNVPLCGCVAVIPSPAIGDIVAVVVVCCQSLKTRTLYSALNIKS